MKKISKLSLLSAAILVAATHQTQAGFGNFVGGLYADSAVSAEILLEQSRVAIGLSVARSGDSNKISKKALKDAKEALIKGSEFVVNKTVKTSDGLVVVLTESKGNLSADLKLLKDNFVKVVNSSGEFLSVQLDDSREFFKALVETTEDGEPAVIMVGKHVLGKLKASPGKTFEALKDAKGVLVNASGQVYADSKTMLGTLVDNSGRGINYLAEESAEFFYIQNEDIGLSLRASDRSMKAFSKDIDSDSKEIRVSLKASADNSLIFLNKIGDESGRSYLFIADNIKDLLHSIDIALQNYFFGDS